MEAKEYEKLSDYVLYRCIDKHVGGAVALYGAVVVWLGFVYSICYTGSFHQLCESVLFVFIVRVKLDFDFMGEKSICKE